MPHSFSEANNIFGGSNCVVIIISHQFPIDCPIVISVLANVMESILFSECRLAFWLKIIRFLLNRNAKLLHFVLFCKWKIDRK